MKKLVPSKSQIPGCCGIFALSPAADPSTMVVRAMIEGSSSKGKRALAKARGSCDEQSPSFTMTSPRENLRTSLTEASVQTTCRKMWQHHRGADARVPVTFPTSCHHTVSRQRVESDEFTLHRLTP